MSEWSKCDIMCVDWKVHRLVVMRTENNNGLNDSLYKRSVTGAVQSRCYSFTASFIRDPAPFAPCSIIQSTGLPSSRLLLSPVRLLACSPQNQVPASEWEEQREDKTSPCHVSFLY